MSGGARPWDDVLRIAEAIAAARQEMLRSRGGTRFNAGEMACVEARFGSAWTSECYVEDPRKIPGFTFACALLVNLLMGHCLTDGNKRLAWICLTLALARIGCDLEADDEAAERLCLDVVTRHLDHAAVARWVAGRIVPLG